MLMIPTMMPAAAPIRMMSSETRRRPRRAISFNGLANAFHITAINGGRHVAPLFAGGTVFAWSEVLAKSEVPGRNDVGALRLRTVATKDRPCTSFPYKIEDDYEPSVILDLDYWALIPR